MIGHFHFIWYWFTLISVIRDCRCKLTYFQDRMSQLQEFYLFISRLIGWSMTHEAVIFGSIRIWKCATLYRSLKPIKLTLRIKQMQMAHYYLQSHMGSTKNKFNRPTFLCDSSPRMWVMTYGGTVDFIYS